MFPKIVPHALNHPLAAETTYRIGGAADVVFFPESLDHLKEIFGYLEESQKSYFVLGLGSNVLAPDGPIRGVIISTKKLKTEIQCIGEDVVRATASVSNNQLLRFCADLGLGGVEILAGVPGNLGGAIVMNAGTADGWVADRLIQVEAFHYKSGLRIIKKEDLKYSYRQQHFLAPDEVVWAATLQFQKSDPESVKKVLGECAKKRKQAQPIEMPSCGSVFRNPTGTSAWKVLDALALRGVTAGGAQFSPKHCNFIVNNGGASAVDVLSLIQLAKKRAKEELGVELHEEVIELRLRALA